MTLLDSFRKWRRGPLAEPPTIFDLPRSAPAVPVTYRALYHYLEHRYATVVVLTFAQMETLLGCALPASASTDAEWWAGSGGSACRHSAAWVLAGRTASPNLAARTVTFEMAPPPSVSGPLHGESRRV